MQYIQVRIRTVSITSSIQSGPKLGNYFSKHSQRIPKMEVLGIRNVTRRFFSKFWNILTPNINQIEFSKELLREIAKNS